MESKRSRQDAKNQGGSSCNVYAKKGGGGWTVGAGGPLRLKGVGWSKTYREGDFSRRGMKVDRNGAAGSNGELEGRGTGEERKNSHFACEIFKRRSRPFQERKSNGEKRRDGPIDELRY